MEGLALVLTDERCVKEMMNEGLLDRQERARDNKVRMTEWTWVDR
jgi:hypothetical protein